MSKQGGERYICKDGVAVHAETAKRLGVEDGVEFEYWADPADMARAVFSLSPEQAKAVRESVSNDE